MRLALSLVAVLVSAVPAAAETRNLDIADIIAQHEALNNKPVRVRGWIRSCDDKACDLAEQEGGQGAKLSLGAFRNFDRDVARYSGLEIEAVIEASVHRKCFDHAGEPPQKHGKKDEPCSGRSDQLAQARLMRVLTARPMAPAGAN